MIPAAQEREPIDWRIVKRVIADYCDEVGRENQRIGRAKTPSELMAKLNKAGYFPVPCSGAYITTKVWKRSHEWLELGGKIIDVTHSQFGAPDWLITDIGEPYIPTPRNPPTLSSKHGS